MLIDFGYSKIHSRYLYSWIACLTIIGDVVLLYVKQIQLFSFQKVSWAMSLNSRWTDDSKFLLKFFKRFFLIGLFDNDLCLETQQQSQIVEKIPLWDRQILMTAMTFQLQLYKMNCSLLHVKRWHGELTTKNGFFVRLILKLGAHGFNIFPWVITIVKMILTPHRTILMVPIC